MPEIIVQGTLQSSTVGAEETTAPVAVDRTSSVATRKHYLHPSLQAVLNEAGGRRGPPLGCHPAGPQRPL